MVSSNLQELGLANLAVLFNNLFVDTLMDLCVKLLPNQGETFSDPESYRRLVGKLNYLTVTQPNISFAVSEDSDGRGRVQHLKPLDTKNRGHKESNAKSRAIVSQRGVGRNLTGRLSEVQSQPGSSNKETRTGSVNSKRLMKKLQLNSSVFEKANGFSGGIWIDDGPSFLCTVVYGSPREDERHVMWDDVKQLSLNVNLPWILAGDFNDIKCMGEKKGGSQPDSNKCDRFAGFLNDCHVDDLISSGFEFTWHHSDHSPLLVKFSNRPNLWQDRPFRFIASWLDHPNFNDLMQDKWNKNVDFNQMLNRFVPILKKWNKEVYGNIGRRENSLVNDIASVQLKRSVADSPNLHELEISLQISLDHVLEEEELLWFQKSRHNWIMDGDKNTKFYHLRTVIRRSSNKISRLRCETNQWIENVNELKDHVCSFYKTLFTEDIEERRWLASANHWTSLSNALKDDLIKVTSMAEVTKLLNGMNAFKASGLDGFPAIFFQKQWNLVKDQVYNAVIDMWSNPDRVEEFNNTLLVLIPKVKRPDCISQFRPISLFPVLYKILSRVIVHRLKPVMDKLISPSQVSFVPGRQIQDNIVIVQELIHSMHKMKVCSNLQDQCLWNGGKTEDFRPSRGIRQGDPLSPYLFVIALEKLTHIINTVVLGGLWNPFRVGNGGPRLSHISFADDLMLFMEATEEQIDVLLHCLHLFEEVSGQRLSVDNTSVYFSRNASEDVISRITQKSGFKRVRNMGRYLGSMMQHGRASKELYAGIIENVRDKMNAWNQQSLSQAGRITLSQSVVVSMPYFQMQSCKIPLSVCNEIEKLQRSFIWGDKEGRKANHLINWSTITSPKEVGGLGLKRLEFMNDAMLAKRVWSFSNKPDHLWVQVLKSKYESRSSRAAGFVACNGDSSLWKNMCRIWRMMEGRLRWEVGDGRIVSFWHDNWLTLAQPLRELVTSPNLDVNDVMCVADMVNSNGDWNYDSLGLWFPRDVIDIFRGTLTPGVNDGPDSKYWDLDGENTITVRAIYKALVGQELISGLADGRWQWVWDWNGPQRIKLFMWKVCHKKLLTRSRTALWGTGTESCPICREESETLLHAIRDCHEAKSVWSHFVPSDKFANFFFGDVDHWLSVNMDMDKHGITNGWRNLFFVICWKNWKWRNELVHGSAFPCLNVRKRIICSSARDINNALASAQERLPVKFSMKMDITWQYPTDGSVIINIDGAVRGNPGLAACGGLIRNSQGRWLGGFAYKLGICSSFKAELWGVLRGLELAWNEGFRNIIIESDSSSVITVLTKSGVAVRECHLIARIQTWINRSWSVTLMHTYREGNVC
ncbi:uncharacterized protein LOC133292825 [Gastrolobium bilobum]|uniref:uncharacterized protein LOC133292825 n=1 Tax=Gastrolobium bilobum TaxID=150636 RepID=UPI002AAF3BE5|nr:uncharacterized protein LOC133292825 [Gastrolobium bilobum]